jgi:phospholipase/carboxylesterase
MNRIAFATEKLLASPTASSLHDSYHVSTLRRRRFHRASNTQQLPRAIYAPLHYEPGYAYPLLVWLHGRGGNERELLQIMPGVSLRNYVAVAPRGPLSASRRSACFDWQQAADGIEEAESRILHSIAAVQERFNIHSERVFLVGCGSGGTMAMRVAWNHPEHFAGVATLGGALPSEHCPLRRVNDMRRLPCLVATSRLSRTYPENHVCRDLRLMHAAGCTVALRQYPGGDDLTTGMLSDLNHWLMELVCGSGAEQQSSRAAER